LGRRFVLKASLGAILAGPLAAPLRFLRADEEGQGASKHDRYVVTPKDFRKFNARRRFELGIHGNYFSGQMHEETKTAYAGFLAWLTEDEAKQIGKQEDVSAVTKLSSEDIPGPDKRAGGAKQLAIVVVPNVFESRPDAKTFRSAKALAETWAKEFASLKGLKFSSDKEEKNVAVEIPEGEVSKELVEGLKKHAQVVGLLWLNPTTVTPGEEGGVVTTRALGEEGITTQPVREEGGATTEAVGEEGATTLAVGEEGGPTTKALGEEGGPSTRALGEEGGPTTLRVGEEGGPAPRPPKGGGGVTTQALGEEGR
jgi:hypothetical protein